MRSAAPFAADAGETPCNKAGQARAFLDIVTPQALRFDLPPSLLFAVIDSASAFDPHAALEDGGLGLMGLRPGDVLDDAMRLLGRGREEVTADRLHTPSFAIEAGAACLHLLDTRILADVADPTARLTALLACHAADSHAVAQAMGVDAGDSPAAAINALSPGQLRERLVTSKHLPADARARTTRALEAIAAYRAFDRAYDAVTA